MARWDVGLLTAVAFTDKSDNRFPIGRVQRMVKPASGEKIEYLRPVNIDEDSSQNVIFFLVLLSSNWLK